MQYILTKKYLFTRTFVNITPNYKCLSTISHKKENTTINYVVDIKTNNKIAYYNLFSCNDNFINNKKINFTLSSMNISAMDYRLPKKYFILHDDNTIKQCDNLVSFYNNKLNVILKTTSYYDIFDEINKLYCNESLLNEDYCKKIKQLLSMTHENDIFVFVDIDIKQIQNVINEHKNSKIIFINLCKNNFNHVKKYIDENNVPNMYALCINNKYSYWKKKEYHSYFNDIIKKMTDDDKKTINDILLKYNFYCYNILFEYNNNIEKTKIITI
jgi:hypothetical protein